MNLRVIVSVKIDEPWSHNQSVGIDRALGEAGRTSAYLRDLTVLDPDVALKRGTRVPSTTVPPLM